MKASAQKIEAISQRTWKSIQFQDGDLFRPCMTELAKTNPKLSIL